MGFSAKIHPVPLETGIVKPLLVQAKRLLELEHAPEGRSGFTECEKFDALLDIVGF
jgi:hypothetical protein